MERAVATLVVTEVGGEAETADWAALEGMEAALVAEAMAEVGKVAVESEAEMRVETLEAVMVEVQAGTTVESRGGVMAVGPREGYAGVEIQEAEVEEAKRAEED